MALTIQSVLQGLTNKENFDIINQNFSKTALQDGQYNDLTSGYSSFLINTQIVGNDSASSINGYYKFGEAIVYNNYGVIGLRIDFYNIPKNGGDESFTAIYLKINLNPDHNDFIICERLAGSINFLNHIFISYTSPNIDSDVTISFYYENSGVWQGCKYKILYATDRSNNINKNIYNKINFYSNTTDYTTEIPSEDTIICLGEIDTVLLYSTATSDTLGLVKIGYSENGKNYPVELNSSGQMYVNVPWTDNNTTYSAGTGLTLSGTTFNHSNSITAGNGGPTANATLTFGGTFTVPYFTYDAQGHITGRTNRIITMPANPNTDTHWTANLYVGTSTASSNSAQTNGNVYLVLRENGTTRNAHKISGSGATTVTSDKNGNITISSTDNNTNYYPTSWSWSNGTTSGPTATLSGSGMSSVSIGAIPAASASQSGIVTTGNQTFEGSKTFNDPIIGSLQGNASTATKLQTARTIDGTSFDGTSNIKTQNGYVWGVGSDAPESGGWYKFLSIPVDFIGTYGNTNLILAVTWGFTFNANAILAINVRSDNKHIRIYTFSWLARTSRIDKNDIAAVISSDESRIDFYVENYSNQYGRIFFHTLNAGGIAGEKINVDAITVSSTTKESSTPSFNQYPVDSIDINTTYTLTKSGSTITLNGSDGSSTSVSDSNTTYSNATTSTAGLMSAVDKAKLDGIQSGADAVSFSRSLSSGTAIGTITINGTSTTLYAPIAGESVTYDQATSSTLGLVKIGYAENGKNYPVKLNSSGQMFVNVPWTDNNTTYENATTSNAGLMSASDKNKLDSITFGADSVLFTSNLDSGTKIGTLTINGNPTILYAPTAGESVTYEQATSSTLGLVRIGYSENGKNYPVELNSSGQMYVNVPWTDTNTNTTYTLSKSGSTITLTGSDGSQTSVTDTDTNTHYTSYLYVGAEDASSNSAVTSPYLTLRENGIARSSIRFVGSGGTTVTSDSSGNITISSTSGSSSDTRVTQYYTTATGAYPLLFKYTSGISSTSNTTSYARYSNNIYIDPRRSNEDDELSLVIRGIRETRITSYGIKCFDGDSLGYTYYQDDAIYRKPGEGYSELTYTLPTKSGTIALTSDITSGGGSSTTPYSLTLSLNGSSSTFNGGSAVSKSWYAPTSVGTNGYFLRSAGSGAPIWESISTIISEGRLTTGHYKFGEIEFEFGRSSGTSSGGSFNISFNRPFSGIPAVVTNSQSMINNIGTSGFTAAGPFNELCYFAIYPPRSLGDYGGDTGS